MFCKGHRFADSLGKKKGMQGHLGRSSGVGNRKGLPIWRKGGQWMADRILVDQLNSEN